MRKAHWGALAVLAGTLVVLSWAGPALSQRPARLLPMAQDIARQTRLREESVDKVLTALGPAVSRQLAAGRTVTIQGLGTFRVVRIPEHRGLDAGGKPAIIPGVNYVEFLPAGPVVAASNSADARPAVVVPPFQYNTLPTQTPSPHIPYGGNRVPSTRVP